VSVATEHKKCPSCQQLKTIDEFGKNRRMPDGHHYWCRDCVRTYMHSDRGRAALKRAIGKKQQEGYYRFGRGAIPILRQGAEKRGIAFRLTADELESWWKTTPDVCEYCGCSVAEFRQLRDAVLAYGGDSRDLINALGYELENLVKACWFCNYVKGTLLTHEDMKIVGRRVIARLREGLAVGSR